MDETTILLALSQMALAIAGFSGITIAFTRTHGRLSELEKYRLRWLFGNAFAAMFLSLVPVILMAAQPHVETARRISSGALAAFSIVIWAVQLAPTRRFLRETPTLFRTWILYSLAAGHTLNLVLQILAASGVLPDRAEGIFIGGIAWLLFHAVYQFSRILFVRPAR